MYLQECVTRKFVGLHLILSITEYNKLPNQYNLLNTIGPILISLLMKANYSKYNEDIQKIQLAPYKTIIYNFLSLSGSLFQIDNPVIKSDFTVDTLP